ncbi:MAG: WecB/TagA/CpsF family glycosyltransferase [Verrucomicrobia bacterium]|nr:WecB/TagA/CpsF family glycosyltransferase [Verrucomicrobiota bacterium]
MAIEFVNTHIVAMHRRDAAARDLMSGYDWLLPDGMPLVWCLNLNGAKLRDRVYGPTFMRKFLETAPAGSSHYLLGGSAECGARLREIFTRRNPGLKFVGGFHGRCSAEGLLEGAAETEVVAEINRLSPDFIWVGFGTPKQQAWTRRHKHLLRRGVVLTVGFAFDVNAGMKPDAPLWMQRCGLTWLFRLASEPQRLLGRFVKYNSLFLFYLLWDGVRGELFAPGK